jgi:hypothetical protein
LNVVKILDVWSGIIHTQLAKVFINHIMHVTGHVIIF